MYAQIKQWEQFGAPGQVDIVQWARWSLIWYEHPLKYAWNGLVWNKTFCACVFTLNASLASLRSRACCSSCIRWSFMSASALLFASCILRRRCDSSPDAISTCICSICPQARTSSAEVSINILPGSSWLSWWTDASGSSSITAGIRQVPDSSETDFDSMAELLNGGRGCIIPCKAASASSLSGERIGKESATLPHSCTKT